MRRLTILLAALGALMLVPAASAFAEDLVFIKVAGTGSGEVIGVGEQAGEPPIACSYTSPGPATGVCATDPFEFEEETGFYSILLQAKPAPGSKFVGWASLKGSGLSGNSCPTEKDFLKCNYYNFEEEFEVSELQATFCLEGEILTLEGKCGVPNLALNVEEGSGTVVSNPAGLECSGSAPKTCEAKVAEGKVTLTASPGSGYLVKSWKGCDPGGVNGRQCTVTAGSSLKTVGVKFYKVFRLKGSKTGGVGIMGTAPGGINCGYACVSSSALFKEGGLTVKAKPAKHFHFVEFKGGTGSATSCNGVTAESCTIPTFNSNSAIEEVYAEDIKNTLVVNKEGGGQGFIKTKPTNINCGLTCTFAEAEFFAGESPEITVTLGKGTSSVTWTSGGGTCTGNALTCTVPLESGPGGRFSLVAKFN